MKKNYIRFLLIFALFFSCFFLISCKKKEEPKIEPKITISVNNNMDFIYEVGTENVNFKDFFKIVNEKGEEIPVEDAYLDLSNVDFSKEGSFTVTINYQNETKTISFVVVKGSSEPTEPTETVINPPIEPTKTEEIDLSKVFSKYENYEDYNYSVRFVANCLTDPSYSWESIYHVLGYNMAYTYEGEDQTYTDYIYFIGDEMYYACEYDDTYYIYSETNDSEEFHYYYDYVDYFDFSDLNELEFVFVDDHYEAVDPIKAGKYIFGGNETDDTYSKIELYIENELISKVIGYNKYTDDEGSFDYIITIEVSEYGKVEFELPEIKEKTPTPISDDTLTTHFTSKDLECNNGEVEYTADKGAFGFDEVRGAQFLQNAGAVTITSSVTVENVNSVTLTVASNADAGMTVSVYVGDTLFTPSLANGLVPKTNFNENTVIEFTSNEYANGVVKVILTPNQDSKSMYISIISLKAKENIGPKEVMEAQEYNEETFDDKIIRDAQKEFEGAAGLMPTGEYHVLVIPVEFNEAKFDSRTLELLEKAFNGTPSETGYNSVSSFYKESSYGKLNITFDIMNPYLAKNTVKYYKDYFDDENELEGDSQLLLEALEYYDNDIDYNQYDIDKDGFLDGVYILYSCDVDYDVDSIYWAYVTQYVVKNEKDNKKFDGLEIYYYMFAGANFVYEDIDASDYIEIYEKMPGLKANALTFIHESGHMFGLDDYYDYDEILGSNLGIGASFMMGNNYGDHDPYSKTILGWINPEVVVENGTYTLNDFEEAGDTLLIPLKFNNSYFSEYLLIQLYTDNKLNEFFKDKEGYQIFEGAEYGVAVFFVSSELIEKTEDINDKYYCLTKYNNSKTSTPLIWLLEADGEQHFESNNGVTSSTDLWKVGDSFSEVFPEFSRSDGKLVNFDFVIVSLTDGTSEIKVTFNE